MILILRWLVGLAPDSTFLLAGLQNGFGIIDPTASPSREKIEKNKSVNEHYQKLYKHKLQKKCLKGII